MNKPINIILLSLLLLLLSCDPKGYKDIPSYSELGALHAIIEIPAGGSQMVKYEPQNQGFKYFREDGIITRIQYFPSPVNFGFIPSTSDGESFVKIVVISESVSSGSLIEVDLIGAVEISGENRKEFCLISLPHNKNMRTLAYHNLEGILENYPEFKAMFEKWYSKMSNIEDAEFYYVRSVVAEKKLTKFMN